MQACRRERALVIHERCAPRKAAGVYPRQREFLTGPLLRDMVEVREELVRDRLPLPSGPSP